MPTPLDLLLDPATQVLFALFGGLLLWELVAPARALPQVRGWTLRALAAFGALLPAVLVPAAAVGRDIWRSLQLFDLAGWPAWAAVAAGVLAYELGAYAWHRAMHRLHAAVAAVPPDAPQLGAARR